MSESIYYPSDALALHRLFATGWGSVSGIGARAKASGGAPGSACQESSISMVNAASPDRDGMSGGSGASKSRVNVVAGLVRSWRTLGANGRTSSKAVDGGIAER